MSAKTGVRIASGLVVLFALFLPWMVVSASVAGIGSTVEISMVDVIQNASQFGPEFQEILSALMITTALVGLGGLLIFAHSGGGILSFVGVGYFYYEIGQYFGSASFLIGSVGVSYGLGFLAAIGGSIMALVTWPSKRDRTGHTMSHPTLFAKNCEVCAKESLNAE